MIRIVIARSSTDKTAYARVGMILWAKSLQTIINIIMRVYYFISYSSAFAAQCAESLIG